MTEMNKYHLIVSVPSDLASLTSTEALYLLAPQRLRHTSTVAVNWHHYAQLVAPPKTEDLATVLRTDGFSVAPAMCVSVSSILLCEHDGYSSKYYTEQQLLVPLAT